LKLKFNLIANFTLKLPHKSTIVTMGTSKRKIISLGKKLMLFVTWKRRNKFTQYVFTNISIIQRNIRDIKLNCVKQTTIILSYVNKGLNKTHILFYFWAFFLFPGYSEPRLLRTNVSSPMQFVITEFDCIIL
jgi:hypothetical protein